uniref:Globin n=1 Tax=Polypedilum nubifer TaxID=54969 RepID=V5YM44_9DIPT|nr:globin [Polypedilum nubifer]
MDPPIPPLRDLSDRQVDIIKSTWAILNENPEESGEAIFYTFLERHPEHQKRYTAFRNKPLEELKGTPQIRRHSGKIMNIFNTAIEALGTENCKSTVFNAISDNADFHGKKGIKKEHYNQLRDIMLETVAGACTLDDEGKEAWSCLMDVVYHITFNVLDELRK